MSPSGTGSPTSSATRSRSAPGQHGAAAVDADDGDASPPVLLDDLVCDAHQRAPHVVAVEDDLVAQLYCPFLASRDRVKGTAARLATARDAGIGGGHRRTGPRLLARSCARVLPALGERHLDPVEVARHDRALEHRPRLVAQLAAGVARRDVREREQRHLGLRGQLGGARAVEWPVSSARSASSSRKVASCTSRSAPWATARVISHGAVSPASTTLRPRRRSPSTWLGLAPPPHGSPRWRRPKSGPGATPSSWARLVLVEAPGPLVLDQRVAVARARGGRPRRRRSGSRRARARRSARARAGAARRRCGRRRAGAREQPLEARRPVDRERPLAAAQR